jgi:4a-hydroxytetrahydrobiopterin dehydratase
MPQRLLAPDEIARRHSDVPGWCVVEKCLTLKTTFPSFADAIDFINEVARLAEKANHHPDIDLRHRTVKLSLTTHSAGGLTDADFTLARHIDELQD